jgi:rsbT co-antagonist protein RsbR
VTHQLEHGRLQTLAHELGLDEANIERRKKIVGLDKSDLSRIATIKDIVLQHADDYVAAFFGHLSGLEEAKGLMVSKPLLDRANQLKREHLVAMVSGEYGLKYAEQRLELAVLYAAASLETRAFLGAFHHLLKNIGLDIMKQPERAPLDAFESFMSLNKIAFFDIGLTVDALLSERERTIRQQAEAIRELSTPVLQLRDRMLLSPIIGVIDTVRARLITENLLRAIRANRVKVVVMDVTGVATIDSKVANHILQTVAAARLMGAEVIVTGLSSEVAQSLVALGIDLSTLNTVGDLQGGLEAAERVLGYRVVLNGTAATAGS